LDTPATTNRKVPYSPRPEVTQLELVYGGNEVDDGTIPIEYMIDALMGFSVAYEKIAARTIRNADHQIRVVGIEQQDSTHIVLNIMEWAHANPAAAGAAFTALGIATAKAAYTVIKDIAKLISGKKHLAGGEPKIIFEGTNILLINRPEEPLQLTKEQLEFLREGLIDPDLDRLTTPLDHTNVTKFELRTDKIPIADVSKQEREYFLYSPKSVTTTKDDLWITGMLNSLAKDKNRGTFHTVTGLHVPYRYVGHNKEELLRAFAHRGLVRVRARVALGTDLQPVSLQIYSVQLDQQDLFSSAQNAQTKPRPTEHESNSKKKKERRLQQGR
jgi:hypothetical protein